MEQQAEQVLKVIINCAQKGKAGDDKVFISDIKEAAYMVPI
jgi:nitrogen regulatory protein PII